MYAPDPGWVRPVLAFVLVVLGVILRFTIGSRIDGFGLRRHRAQPDEDILVKVRLRMGEMLLLWAAWVVLQITVGVPDSLLTSLWAPLLIVIALSPSYAARLYAQRYLSDRGIRSSTSTGWLAWLWIILRELIPLAAILIPILIIRANYAVLPTEIPVGWNLRSRVYTWMDVQPALEILRHRTMLVYMVLFGLEGAYLLLRWVRGRGADFTERLLSRSHWLYFLFKLGWVLLFSGLNLGLVFYAAAGGTLLPFLLPGLFTLSSFAILVVMELRQTPSTPVGES